MSQALYRKYRSRSFDEIVGQKGVVTALTNALDSNKLSHAYLFTGPRGVGKTSIARIFAFSINAVPYTDDTLPVDIIEVDAASNRGIDEVRDLREKVRIAPVVGPYKIYIIDEVHMLTTHAFNALLKTLEEPPAHAIFILATTESHKLPETITSRTQRYNFTLATIDETAAHLTKVSQLESIDIDAEAIRLIAASSGGSMRDALSLLDHAKHLGTHITAEDIRLYIGVPSQETVNMLLSALTKGDSAQIMSELDTADACGVTAIALAHATITELTTQLQNGTCALPLATVTKLLQQLLEVDTSVQHDAKIRIAFLSALQNPPKKPKLSKQIPMPKKPEESQMQVETPKAPPQSDMKQMSEKPHAAPTPIATTDDASEPTELLTEESWKDALEHMRSSHNTLYSLLRMARIDLSEIEARKIRLGLKFPFHMKRISEVKNREIINAVLVERGLGPYELICDIQSDDGSFERTVQAVETLPVEKDPMLHQIRGVFGSAEVLE